MATEDPEATMVIRSLTPSITIVSMPFTRMGMHFGLRSTIVRLRSGNLAVFSPSPLTPSVRTALSNLSPPTPDQQEPKVKYIIAPDYEHHLHLSAWKQAFPSAHVLGVEGLYEKRLGQLDPAKDWIGPFDHVYTAPNKRTDAGKWGNLPKELGEEFDVEYFHTHTNKELAYLHKADGGTLIEADLLFNLPAKEQYSKTNINPSSGLMTRMVMCIAGAPANSDANGQRVWLQWYMLGRANRKEYADSAKVVSSWQFDRIIPCHGDVIDNGGKRIFDNVFKCFLEMKP